MAKHGADIKREARAFCLCLYKDALALRAAAGPAGARFQGNKARHRHAKEGAPKTLEKHNDV